MTGDRAVGAPLYGTLPLQRKPIGMVRLFDEQGTVEFQPMDDIRALELSMLLNLAVMLLQPYAHFDWRGYLVEHNLLRHFKTIGDKDPA